MSMTPPRRAAKAVVLGLALWLAMSAAAADRAKVLNVYAWAEYFPPALVAKFQAETGIHVNYAVLDSPETAETILSVGHSGYDIVTMNAAPELAREIPKGFWKKLDPAQTADALKAVTLASLVEKETGVAGERKVIAGVFANRIAKDMRLDCDPTTIYAALLDNRYTGVIHKSDLLNQNPYNTYQNAGLPPGPIANPGAASIAAALDPAATDYLFFVAKADGGGHVFSTTRADHEKAVLAYRHAKHKAG